MMNKHNIKNFFKDSATISIIFVFVVISFFAVSYRMKSVELDYEKIEVEKSLKKVQAKNKRLKAQRAKLLSVEELNQLAKRLEMKEPSQKQIIVIPE